MTLRTFLPFRIARALVRYGVVEAFRFLYLKRRYIIQKTIFDLRKKYSQALLGPAWIFATPLLFFTLYATVQLLIYRVPRPNVTTLEFVIMMFVGVMSIFGLIEPMSTASSVLKRNTAILMNHLVPAELSVAQMCLPGFMNCLVGVSLATIGGFFLDFPRFTVFLVPFVLVLHLMFVFGVCWFISLAALIVQDIQFILRFLTLGLLIISPIGYTLDNVPLHLTLIVYLNPMSYFIITYQSLIIFGTLPPIEIYSTMIIMSVAVFSGGYVFFKRLKHPLADFF